MNNYWDFLKARKDYLTPRKTKRTFVEHAESGFKGSIGKHASQEIGRRIAAAKAAAEARGETFSITSKQREEARKVLMNDMLNMPHNFGLSVIEGAKASDFRDPNKAAKKRGKTFVTHDDGFEGSVGKRAAHVIRQHNAQGINVIPDEKVEETRKLLAQDMTKNPTKYGLTVGKKPVAPAPAPAPSLASNPILPPVKPAQNPQMAKIMRAVKLLQTNNLPISEESIQAILPHLPESVTSDPSANPYPTGLTPEGKFQPQRLATTWGGELIETPEKMEEFRQYMRDNPDRRVQDEAFFERERIKDMESRGQTPENILQMINEGTLRTGGADPNKQSIKELLNRGTGFDARGNPLDMNREADPMGFAAQIAGKRYKPESEGGGLVGSDTRTGTHSEERPEIPAGAGKKKIENVLADQARFDIRSNMTEAQLNEARLNQLNAEMAERARLNASHNEAMANAPDNVSNPASAGDWMDVLQYHRDNPMGGDIPSTSKNRTKTAVDEMTDPVTGELKEEYR